MIFNDLDEVDRCDSAVSQLRGHLHLPETYEFHFHSDSHAVRSSFLHTVSVFSFRWHGFVLNKGSDKLTGPGFRYKESLYKWVCKMACENALKDLHFATLLIDKSGDREFRRELDAYLKSYTRQRGAARRESPITKIRMRDSAASNLVQLADYVAGVINRQEQSKKGADDYFRRIRKQQASLRTWP